MGLTNGVTVHVLPSSYCPMSLRLAKDVFSNVDASIHACGLWCGDLSCRLSPKRSYQAHAFMKLQAPLTFRYDAPYFENK